MLGKYRQHKKELLSLLKNNVKNKYPKQISERQYQNTQKIIRYLFKEKTLIQLIPWENIEKFVFCTRMYDLKSHPYKISETNCIIITLQVQQEIKKWLDMFVYPDHITIKAYDSTHNTNILSFVNHKKEIFFKSVELKKGKITFKARKPLKLNIKNGLKRFLYFIGGESNVK